MDTFHLDDTLQTLSGPTKEQIKVKNQWAVTAFRKYHTSDTLLISMKIDNAERKIELKFDTSFSSSAMKEDIDKAHHGGESMAWFLMSVILGYKYLVQTEIGEGCDYRFSKEIPSDDDLNFLSNEFENIEISGILEESNTNTVQSRINKKHKQINKGTRSSEPSSIIVTLFKNPLVVKEKHI